MPGPIDFSRRSAELEIIDTTELDPQTMGRVLSDLDVVNRRLGGYRTTLEAVENVVAPGDSPLLVLDVGAGGGDMARELIRWGRARDRRVRVVSVDLSAEACVYASRRLRDLPDASVARADVLALPFAADAFDVVVCALFLHHFQQEDAARLVTAMYDRSRYGVVINDLHRHPLAYAGYVLFSRVFGLCRVVRHDGALSVLRAFRRPDFEQLARATGLRIETRWRWAFRWQAIVRKGTQA
jgi:2-polyprenyl-3-methyl-5-hydroxy-6-metoxy-1,4-benzoquinol methylase